MPSDLDVVQFLYGGTGGVFAVGRTLDEGLRRAGLRTGVILHARPADLAEDRSAWAETELVRTLPRRGRLDVTLPRRLARTLAEHPARALLVHIPYGARAVRRALRCGDLAAAVQIEHHPLESRRRRDDVRSARMLDAASAVVLLTDAYRSGYPLADRVRDRGLPLAVIANGVDVTRFRPGPDVSAHGGTGAPRRPFRVGMAGALIDRKDQATLVRAFAIVRRALPDAELELMGDGPNRTSLERLIAELGLVGAVHLHGHLSEDALAEALRGLDVYAHCSAGETQSTAILQAQATALPVVATHAKGVSDAVAHEQDGLLVPAGDVDALAASIVALAQDPSRARTLGRAGFGRVHATATTDTMVAAYLELLGTVDPAGPWKAARSRVGG